MSDLELSRYNAGETLTNHTNHRRSGNDSDAVGFCFFAEDPEEAVHWLSGTCCTDNLVTFEVPDGYMHTANAYYRDTRYPLTDTSQPKKLRTDYCCTSYNRDTLHILDSSTRFRLDGIRRIIVQQICSSYTYNNRYV